MIHVTRVGFDGCFSTFKICEAEALHTVEEEMWGFLAFVSQPPGPVVEQNVPGYLHGSLRGPPQCHPGPAPTK